MSDGYPWALMLAGAGAIVGSFLATLILRWPQGRSVMTGRSACDSCGRTLVPLELVPIVSAIAQRGRCRSCAAPIPATHLRVELAAAAIGLVSGLVAPDWTGAGGAVFGWLLLTLGWLDARQFWLPDALTGTLAAAGLATGAAGLSPSLADRAIGGLAGSAILWGIAAAYRRVRGRDGLGGGDPKMLGGLGLWLGWAMLPAVLLAACLIGLGTALLLHLAGRDVARDTALPFGTLLALAAYPTWIIMVRLVA